jgi:hypothetical protein
MLMCVFVHSRSVENPSIGSKKNPCFFRGGSVTIASLTGPSSPCADDASAEMHFAFWFAPSKLVTFSIFSPYQVEPTCQPFLLPPRRLSLIALPPLFTAPSHPRRPAWYLEMLPSCLNSPLP